MMQRPCFVFAALLSLGMMLPPSLALAQSPGGADFDQRLQRLEEQIVDLSAQVGTVQTMTQSGGGGAAPAGGSSFSSGGSFGGSDDARLADMETQVRALSSQLGEILRRLDQLEQRSGGIAPAPGGTNYGGVSPNRADPQPAEQGTGFSIGGNEPAPAASGFGATIEPGPAGNNAQGGSQSGYFGGSSQGGGQPYAGSNTQPIQTAARSSPEAQNLYSRAYDALVQRNYRAASQDFEQFVQNFPADPLAGQAYFWLGESSFTNGQYKQAADSFLKSSTNYPQNEKAAESLLKLGISLRRLGEQNAACSSFSELSRRFPNATPILQRAEREKSRAQC